jgi:hypothetical protein
MPAFFLLFLCPNKSFPEPYLLSDIYTICAITGGTVGFVKFSEKQSFKHRLHERAGQRDGLQVRSREKGYQKIITANLPFPTPK